MEVSRLAGFELLRRCDMHDGIPVGGLDDCSLSTRGLLQSTLIVAALGLTFVAVTLE